MSEFKQVFDEFKSWERREHDAIHKRLEIIDTKIDELREFRWRLMGQISVISFFTAGITTALMQVVMKKVL